MGLPDFLKEVGDTVVYNRDDGSEMVYYVPEEYFNNTSKNPIAEIAGEYVSMIGLCQWAIIDKNGKTVKTNLLNIPTIILCKPYVIDKVKDLKIGTAQPSNYRILRFRYNDELISHTNVPQNVENAELLFKLLVFTAKIPTIIPYDKLWELFMENAKINGFSYNINIQLFGVLLGSVCRNPKNISEPFRYTTMNDMHNYQPISIRLVPKYISPYTAITSENWDDGVKASIMLSQNSEEDIPDSPLEKIIMQ
jgi:hypothetical protein